MEKIITYENLRSFAYSNDRLIKAEVKGIVVNFPGLGGMPMFNTDSGEAREFAEKGIIYVTVYYNPWSWMNRQAVAYTDEVISVLCRKYGLGEDAKIVSVGGSMGGLAALVYCAYAKITPCACVANCPVCDLPYHFTERPDLPRTIYSAFGEYACDLQTAMRSCSPLHLAEKMPDISYTVFHCTHDRAVNMEKHSVPFVEAMKKDHRIDFHVVPLHDHCDLSPEASLEYIRSILANFN